MNISEIILPIVLGHSGSLGHICSQYLLLSYNFDKHSYSTRMVHTYFFYKISRESIKDFQQLKKKKTPKKAQVTYTPKSS